MVELRDEIKAAIELVEDEWPVIDIVVNSEDSATVLWGNGQRQEFTWEEYDYPGQDRWDYRREEVYQVGGYCIECVHIDGEVFQDSHDSEVDLRNDQWYDAKYGD